MTHLYLIRKSFWKCLETAWKWLQWCYSTIKYVLEGGPLIHPLHRSIIRSPQWSEPLQSHKPPYSLMLGLQEPLLWLDIAGYWYISTMAPPWGMPGCLSSTPQVNNKTSTVARACPEPLSPYSLMFGLQEPLLWLDIAGFGIYPPWHIPGGCQGAFHPLHRSIVRPPQSPEPLRSHKPPYSPYGGAPLDPESGWTSGPHPEPSNESGKQVRTLYKSIIWKLQKH